MAVTLHLYKIGTKIPVLKIEDAVSYTDSEVRTADGTVYSPLAEDCELSSLPDCSETLRADWRAAQRPQDIPLVLCQGVTPLEGRTNSLRRSADGLAVVSVAVQDTGHVADLPEGYRPGATISSGDITVRPDGSVWATSSGVGVLCFFPALL